jgi:hypothetical protein
VTRETTMIPSLENFQVVGVSRNLDADLDPSVHNSFFHFVIAL